LIAAAVYQHGYSQIEVAAIGQESQNSKSKDLTAQQ